MISAEEREDIFRDIWGGAITLFALPLVLFSDTWKELQKGLFRGFGGNLETFAETSTDFKVLTRLNENINKFSAAKTFQFTKDSQNLILDAQGNLRPFTDFRKDVKKIYDIQHETWLKTEFETTVANAQSAAQWQDIQRDKKTLPLLKYQTAGDDRVRPLHAAWDGIVKPVDDPFWDTRSPQNDFGCRCNLIQLEEGEEKITNLGDRLEKVKKETKGKIKSLDNDSKLFNINPGKFKIIFPRSHPYFRVDDTFNELKKRNFDLPNV